MVTAFDADNLNMKEILSSINSDSWSNRLSTILPILIDNIQSRGTGIGHSVSQDAYLLSQQILDLPNELRPEWVKSRILSPGEVSVLLKHYYALAAIANSPDHDYGLVAEDDILVHKNSGNMVKMLNIFLNQCEVDYIDLAGGAGLEVSSAINNNSSQFVLINTPRTRTNACYLISRNLARDIVNGFLPLVYPIDWHIQYILSTTNNAELDSLRCYWA
ncbi:MAG: hypothetical protein FJ077_15430, partial [Cyanobacteria bacterium K_DeepCast_35m_m2_023]|nr:hypothetical protein [Cyanobacteria bacterium K_DeepCast_35m_m2_023]